MPAAFPDTRLLRAGISAARVDALRAAYDIMDTWEQARFRALVVSRPDEVLRRTYDPAGVAPAGTSAADVVADPALLTAVQTAILAAHDSDVERETFTPSRLSDAALRAAFGSSQRRLLAVASNGFAGGGASSAPGVAGTGEKLHTVGVDASDLRLVYSNFLASTGVDADGPATYPIKVALRVGGTIYRTPFRGVASLSLDPGGVAVTDPLAVEVAAGSQVYSRTFVNSVTWRPNTASFTGTGGFTNTTDLTDPGAAVIADATKWMLAPSAVLGYPRNPAARAFAIVGDSMAAGTADTNAFGGTKADGTTGGWPARALFGKAGWINVAVPSDSGFSFLASHFRRMALFDYVTDVLCQYGTNDLYNASRTVAQLQADWAALWKLFTRRGLRVWQSTLLPRTTDTAGTLPFTDGKETNRVAANTWLRAGVPLDPTALTPVTVGTSGALLAGQSGHPITGIIEVADVIETARNSGVWKTGYTVDGVHPVGVGAAPAAVAAAATPGLFG
jgi:hypothetical protein